MSKVIYYRFFTLDDMMRALEYINKEAEEYEKKIPGIHTECKTSIGDRDYYIELFITHESEDE